MYRALNDNKLINLLQSILTGKTETLLKNRTKLDKMSNTKAHYNCLEVK